MENHVSLFFLPLQNEQLSPLNIVFFFSFISETTLILFFGNSNNDQSLYWNWQCVGVYFYATNILIPFLLFSFWFIHTLGKIKGEGYLPSEWIVTRVWEIAVNVQCKKGFNASVSFVLIFFTFLIIIMSLF